MTWDIDNMILAMKHLPVLSVADNMIPSLPLRAVRHFAFTVCIILVAACSGGQSESEHLETARAAIESGDSNTALITLKSLLQQNPGNAEARALLGQVQLELGDAASAESEFSRARELGGDSEAILPGLASALLFQRKFDEVLALPPATDSSSTTRAALLTAQAKARLALGQTDAAEALLDTASALDPNSLDVEATNAIILSIEDPEASRKILEDILQQHPDYGPAWALLGNLERRANNPGAAETAYSNAIKYEGGASNYLSRALVRIQLDKLEGAQKDIHSAKAQLSEYFEIDFLQGLLHLKNGKLKEAKSALDASFAKNSEFLPTRIYLAEVNFKLGNLAQAESLATGYLADNPEYIPANKLYAAILLQSDRYPEAETLMGFAVDRFPEDFQLQAMLADALRGQGERAAEVDVLRKMQALQPDNLAVMIRLGSALIALGDEKSGIKLLQSALGGDEVSALVAAKELVEYYSNRGQHDTATQIAIDLQKRHNSAEASILLGLAYAVQDEFAAAEKAFSAALDLSPGNPVANQNLAVIALRDDDYQTARARYENALEYYPDDLQTLLKIAMLDQRENRADDMVNHLEQAIAKHPDASTPRILLARHYLVAGEFEKVEIVLSVLLQTDSENTLALELMGRAQLAQNNSLRAQSSFKSLAGLRPGYAEAHFLLSQAYAQSGESEQVLAELARTLELSPDHFLARLNLAQILYKQEKYPEAAEQLATLKAQAPDNPDIQYLEATVARATGRADEARDLFDKVFASVSNSKTVIALAQQEFDMGDQEFNLGDQEIAIARLEEWLVEHPNDISARAYLAKFYSGLNRHQEAITQYERILEISSTNLVALNNLAWKLRDKDPARALDYAERANNIAGSTPAVADTLAVILMKNNQLDRALRSSEKATSGMAAETGDPSLFFHKAQILNALDRRQETADLLEVLLKNPNEFPEKAEAEALLAQLRID